MPPDVLLDPPCSPMEYTIAKRFSRDVITTHKNLIHEWYLNETTLFEVAVGFVRMWEQGISISALTDMFCMAVKEKTTVPVPLEIISRFATPIYDEYLRLMEDEHYWVNGMVTSSGTPLPFEEVKKYWQASEVQSISRYKKQISLFREVIGS